jgi:hydrogen peroxide-dependent heme synthase
VIESVGPSVGWGVLHLFCRVRAGADGEAVSAAVKSCQADEHQVVSFAALGHKADLGFMALGPDLWRLQQLQADVQAAGIEVADSYVSLTEVSEYAQGMPAEMLDARLHPKLPPEGKTSLCFYPMSKRREPGQNWYSLPYDERKELMYGHGAKGREYAGRILQVITGSTGIDDWEWGVTLFAADPVDLKQCVYEMRFDPASAVYAEFGPFVTGLIAPIDEVLGRVGLA